MNGRLGLSTVPSFRDFAESVPEAKRIVEEVSRMDHSAQLKIDFTNGVKKKGVANVG